MDQFNSFMNNNEHDSCDMNGGQFSDLPGFGNAICMPVNETNGPSEPMPALPQADDMMMGSNSKSVSDMFSAFSNEHQMPNSTMMMSQMNNSANSSSNSTQAVPYDKSKAIAPSQAGIKFYSRNDVLCGRGGGTNVHPGNKRFRDLINANRRAYLKARKNDKPSISRSIVRTIRQMNGRFLKKDEKLGLWFEIGDDGAREKTSQALRQRAPEMKKILFEDEKRMQREQLARQQQQAALMQRSFMNNQSTNSSMNNNNTNFSMNNNNFNNNNFNGNNFSTNSQMMMDNSHMNMEDTNNSFNHNDHQVNNSNSSSIYEQYAMLQQQKYFAREQDVFLKKLAMNGFDPSSFQNQQRDIESLTSQTLLSQGIKPITPRGA